MGLDCTWFDVDGAYMGAGVGAGYGYGCCCLDTLLVAN